MRGWCSCSRNVLFFPLKFPHNNISDCSLMASYELGFCWLAFFICFTGCLHSLYLECSLPKVELWHKTSHCEDPQWTVFSGSFLNSQYSWIWGIHLVLNKLSVSILERLVLCNNFRKKNICGLLFPENPIAPFYSENMNIFNKL